MSNQPEPQREDTETENGTGAAQEGDESPSPYERAQRRLRVEGVAFGRAVKRHRETEGWSQRTLSRKSGVPLTTVANLERGDTAQPDPEVASALAMTFGYGSPGAMLGAGGTRRPHGHGGAAESPSLEATFAAVLRAALGVLDERQLVATGTLAAALAGGAVGAPLGLAGTPLAVNFVVIGAGGVLLLDPTAAPAGSGPRGGQAQEEGA